jgi:murein DD-endopeptidase MepM/ murein hydrolase activator NlpD
MESVKQSTGRESANTERTRSRICRAGLERRLADVLSSLACFTLRLSGDWGGWLPLASRTCAHLVIVALTVGAIALSGADWPASGAEPPADSAPGDPVVGGATELALGAFTRFGSGGASRRLTVGGRVVRETEPHTIIPDRPRLGVVTYTVQAGDTVESIADIFRLEPETVMWANPAVEDAPDLLRIGQELEILPVDGAYHQVRESDTLESIASRYEVEPEAIRDCVYNGLEPPNYVIEEGSWLVVPGGEKPYVVRYVTSYTGPIPEGARGSGHLDWPVLGAITQGYWYGHRAIDIGAPTGSAVLAADGGYVSFAGRTDVGYGNLVVIDHANGGLVTYYAHLSMIYVYEGQAVERGDVIGAVGSTGWSTGPHLHFEVRRYGVQQNPRAYLP